MSENNETEKNGNKNDQKNPSRMKFEKTNLRRAFIFPL